MAVEVVSAVKARRMLAENGSRRKNKYGAKRTRVDGYRFDSKAEAIDFINLKLLRKGGKIKDLTVHPRFPLYVANHITGERADVGHAEMDFMFADIDKNCVRVIDRKGVDNALSRFKRKMVEAIYGVKVEVWKK